MSKVTALSEKLAAKGVLSLNVELQIAIAKFQNNGGEYGVALAMLNAAYGRGKSADALMPKGRSTCADNPRTNAAKGHDTTADKAAGVVPDAAPRNKPGHAKRGLAAISAVQEVVSRSLFDTTKLPDGRSLREVHWAEVPRLAQRYTFLSRVMLLVHRKGVPADPAAKLDAMVSEDELKEIIGSVERLNDLN